MGDSLTNQSQSIPIKGAGRTYILDIEKTKIGKRLLRINESRKGAGEKRERNTASVFPEDAKELAMAITNRAAQL